MAPAPTISVRRGRIMLGSTQVRTTPRSVGTATTASERKNSASSGEYRKMSKPFLRPWPTTSSASEPASSALNSVDTSSKLLRAIAEDWPS